MTDCEIWKPVIGYENLYEVSDQGRVKSLGRTITMTAVRDHGHGPKSVTTTKSYPGKILSPGYRRDHLFVVLYENCSGTRTPVSVHELVLSAFIGPRPDGLVGCHNNGNPKDNSVCNLRWDTQKSNIADKFIHGTICRGEVQWCSKLKTKDVLEIRSNPNNLTVNDRSRQFGVSETHIKRIINRESWRHVP